MPDNGADWAFVMFKQGIIKMLLKSIDTHIPAIQGDAYKIILWV